MVSGRLFACPVLFLVLVHVCASFRYVSLGPKVQTINEGRRAGRHVSWTRICRWRWKSRDLKLYGKVRVEGKDDYHNERYPSEHFDGVEVDDDRSNHGDKVEEKEDTDDCDDDDNDDDDAGSKEEMDAVMEDRRGLTKKPKQAMRDDEANQKVDELLKSPDTSFLKILKPAEFKVSIILSLFIIYMI